MSFKNRKLNFVRLYGKEANLSKIDAKLRNSYRYTVHAMHDPVSSYFIE